MAEKNSRGENLMFILDTNAIIYYLAGKENLNKFIDENKENIFYLPTVVIVEFLSYPLIDKLIISLFEKILSDLVIVNLDLELAQFAGELRRKYKIKTIDAIIASSAIITHSILITYNLKDFEKIKELNLIAP